MRSYRPEELFDDDGRLVAALRALAPAGHRRMSANPHANGGRLRRPLALPDFRDHAVEVTAPGASVHEPTRVLGQYLVDVVRDNPDNFRIFGPDETASNRLDAVYEVTDKVFAGEILARRRAPGPQRPGDGDPLRAHLPGLARGLPAHRPARPLQLLRGVHPHRRLDAQPAREVAQDDARPRVAPAASPRSTTCSPRTCGARTTTASPTRTPASSTTWSTRRPRWSGSTCRRTPTRCSPRCGTAWRSQHYVNVVVAGKQPSFDWLDAEAADLHCARGLGSGTGPRTTATTPTWSSPAPATYRLSRRWPRPAILREHLPDLKVRFVNVVDLMRLQDDAEHPHGLSDRDFDTVFTTDKPVIFAYHGYPWLIHRLTYRRTNHANLHVRGYKEEGTTTTPFDMVMMNDLDRFHLVMDVIDRVPGAGLAGRGAAPGDGRPRARGRGPGPASTARTCPRCATGPGPAPSPVGAPRRRRPRSRQTRAERA